MPPCLNDALAGVAGYWDSFDLAESGVIAVSASELRTELKARCAAILSAGGLTARKH